jgi:polyhydroxyalkanoate synthesis regulator phasin
MKERVIRMTASRADKKDARELVLQDFIRFSARAARGLGNIAEEEGRELIGRMVEINRITPEEGEKLLNTLLARMKSSKVVFEQRVESSVTRAYEKLSGISTRELDSIKTKIDNLDQRINSLVTKRNLRASV